MKTALFFILHFLVLSSIYSQVTFVLDKFPVNTPDNASVYISGDFEGWTGGQEKYILSKKNNTFFITLPEQMGLINFKFTLGSWETVETDEVGKSVDNRIYAFKKSNDTLKINILGWLNSSTRKVTSTKNVSVLSEEFYSSQLDRKRKWKSKKFKNVSFSRQYCGYLMSNFLS